jgi:hypothetical protein
VIVRVDDRLGVLQAVSGEGRDLWHGRLGKRLTMPLRFNDLVAEGAIASGLTGCSRLVETMAAI